MWVEDFIRHRISKIKEVKKFAREKNLPIWQMPVLDSLGVSMIISIYASYITWEWFSRQAEFGMTIPPLIESIIVWLPLIYFFTIFATVMDKIAMFFVLVHSYLSKLVLTTIQKIDHKIWRKTGRDSVIANGIWKIQMKWMKLSKKRRKQITATFILFMVWYYSLRVLF